MERLETVQLEEVNQLIWYFTPQLQGTTLGYRSRIWRHLVVRLQVIAATGPLVPGRLLQ